MLEMLLFPSQMIFSRPTVQGPPDLFSRAAALRPIDDAATCVARGPRRGLLVRIRWCLVILFSFFRQLDNHRLYSMDNLIMPHTVFGCLYWSSVQIILLAQLL